MRAIVVGAADDFVSFCKEEGDLVIAADAGWAQPGVASLADVAIGDYDSLGYVPSGAEVVKLNVRKDFTDTWEAAMLAVERGCDELHFYAVLGGKLDHAIANLQLGIRLAEMGKRAVMHGKDCDVFFVADGSLEVAAAPGTRVSVFSFGESKGVSLKGFEYELEDAALGFDFALGVSNATVAKTARVTVERGALAVFVYEKSGNIRS